MPFTILNTPASLTPVRSPARFVLKDMDHLVVAGTKAQWTITFGSAAAAGQSITIKYGGQEITIDCVSSILADGRSFTAAPSTLSAAANFRDGAKRNYFLNRDFTISATGALVSFTARQYGTDYNLVSVTATAPLSVSSATLITGADRTFRVGHHVGLSVLTEDRNDPGTFIRSADQAMYPADDSIAGFDVSQWLRPLLAPDPVPFTLNTAQPATTSLLNYTLEYWSRYEQGDGVEPRRAVYTQPQRTAWLAGHPRLEAGRFAAWMGGTTTPPYQFLTFRGRTYPREVTRQEKHYLNWSTAPVDLLSLPHGATFTMLARATFPGGTNSSWFSVVTYVVNPLHKILIWPTGWDMIGMDTALQGQGLDPSQAIAYSIRLRNDHDNTIASETYRFDLVMPDYQEQFVQFFSALGAWESVRFTGAWQRTLKPAWQEQTSVLTWQSAEASSSAVPTGAQAVLKLNSAPAPLQEHKAMMDLLQSPAIRLVDTAANRFVPLRIIEADEVPVQARGITDEHLRQLSITCLVDDPDPIITAIP